MFVVSAAIGEMIIPLIVGKVFDYVGSVSFLAEGCILCFTAFGAYLAVLVIGKGAASHSQKREGNIIMIFGIRAGGIRLESHFVFLRHCSGFRSGRTPRGRY